MPQKRHVRSHKSRAEISTCSASPPLLYSADHTCMYKYVQFGASSSAGLFSGRGCAVGGETWAKEPVQMQHMLMGAYRNVRGGGWSSQPTTRERRRQECDEGLRPEGTAFSGRPCEVGSVGAGRGRGMHDAGLSMCFTGRAE